MKMTETEGWYELREDLSREVIDRNWTSAFPGERL